MLKYLFTAQFNDGTELSQNADDVSVNDPTKSAFFDVMQRESEVTRFSLIGEGHTYTVDLADGHFEIDGLLFEAHDQFFKPSDLRLVYHRENHIKFNAGQNEIKDQYINRYFIGWQTTKGGKNTQQTIAIN